MYKCPHTGLHSFGVIHFIGEEGASSYSPEYFAAESEHITLIGDQSFNPTKGAIETLRTNTGV